MKRVTRDLRKIHKVERILEFITFYQNALHLTRVHCAPFYQNALRNKQLKCLVDESVHRSLFSLRQIFYSTRLEVLPNLRNVGVFQMSTMVNLPRGGSPYERGGDARRLA